MPEDPTAARLLKVNDEKCVLRLYVAGSTPQSSRAITNIKNICEAALPGRYVLTVIDLYAEPHRAHEDQIVVAPTLVRQSPLPVRRLIGDLSNTVHVMSTLDLERVPSSTTR